MGDDGYVSWPLRSLRSEKILIRTVSYRHILYNLSVSFIPALSGAVLCMEDSLESAPTSSNTSTLKASLPHPDMLGRSSFAPSLPQSLSSL